MADDNPITEPRIGPPTPKAERTMRDVWRDLKRAKAEQEIASVDFDLDGLEGNDHNDAVDPFFQEIEKLEKEAAALDVRTVDEAVAALEILEPMISAEGWQFSDERDRHLFESIRLGLLALTVRPQPGAQEWREGIRQVTELAIAKIRKEPLTGSETLAIVDELHEIRDAMRLIMVAIEGAHVTHDRAALNGMSRLASLQGERLDTIADRLHPPAA